MSNKILISTSLRNLPQVLTLIKCCFLGGFFFFLGYTSTLYVQVPQRYKFPIYSLKLQCVQDKSIQNYLSQSKVQNTTCVPLIKYPIKINDKKISLSFHDLILYIRKWRYMVPVSRLLQLREIRSRFIVSKNKKIILLSKFHSSNMSHQTRANSFFYQHVIKENKTFLTMFYTLIGFHLV